MRDKRNRLEARGEARARRSSLAIFDFDGTLADTWRDIATALERTLREAALPVASPDDVRAWIGRGMRALVEDALPPPLRGAERVDALLARFRTHYEACCLDTTTLYPGIDACLAALAGQRLAILSNKQHRFLDQIARGLGIVDRFAAVVGGDTSARPKPDPAAVAHVVAQVGGAAPEAVWMIGDSAIDVEAGRAAGARTIGCSWGLRPRAELVAAGADHIVDDPAAIAALVLGAV